MGNQENKIYYNEPARNLARQLFPEPIQAGAEVNDKIDRIGCDQSRYNNSRLQITSGQNGIIFHKPGSQPADIGNKSKLMPERKFVHTINIQCYKTAVTTVTHQRHTCKINTLQGAG
ncbi:MAG: hypothetical protein ABI813_03935 [Bacteroidota bacterium]